MNTHSREIHYFSIGLFILIGTALILTAIILLGSGTLFSKTVYVESYFNESVQGLSVGSPVKYRGLDIGYVKRIAFVNEIYDTPKVNESPYNRYIYVQMAITSSFLTKTPEHYEKSFTQQQIKDGLRIKLAMQGLTGNAYLEFNYVNPKENPPLPIVWQPEHNYVPSAKSTLTEFSNNLDSILDNLKDVNFHKVFKDFDQLTRTTHHVMSKTNNLLDKTRHNLISAISNLKQASSNMNTITERAKDHPSHTLFGNPPPRLNPSKL